MPSFPSAEFIVELSFRKFNSLPKTGKPTKSEWTVLSSIIQFDHTTCESKVVALGAGTKCIGQSKLCPQGLILNDSHAEVLARRAFLRYVVHQLNTGSETFKYDDEACVFCVKESVSFHFFSTQVPCGDACIVSVPKASDSDVPMEAKRRKLDSECLDVGDVLAPVLTPSNVFTGAKLIGETNSDPMHQTVGALRTKPGRGDRTLSMSCSDKLSKWNVLGVQGAFLDAVLEKPIYLQTMNFSCEFDMESMRRAIYGRWDGRVFNNERFIPRKPEIRRATGCQFEYIQDEGKNPSPNGLAWCDVSEDSGPYEVSVNGKKQGITKKALQSKKSSLRISKLRLFEEFCELFKKYPQIARKLGLKGDARSYNDYKAICEQYQQAWSSLKECYFKQWITKPKNLLDFTLLSNKEA